MVKITTRITRPPAGAATTPGAALAHRLGTARCRQFGCADAATNLARLPQGRYRSPRWRSSGRRRSTTHSRLRAAAQRRMADGGFLASRGMTACRQGKKVSGRRCGIGDRGAAVLRPDQAIRGSVERSHPTALGRNVAVCAPIEQEADDRGRRKTCNSAQTAASARPSTGFAPRSCPSRVLEHWPPEDTTGGAHHLGPTKTGELMARSRRARAEDSRQSPDFS